MLDEMLSKWSHCTWNMAQVTKSCTMQRYSPEVSESSVAWVLISIMADSHRRNQSQSTTTIARWLQKQMVV